MLKASDLTSGFVSTKELSDICRELAPRISNSFGLDKPALLMALSGNESSFGKNNVPRFEPAFAPGGKYFKNVQLQGLYKICGALACCSWGPFQIMAIRALELGYDGHPADLHDPKVSGPFVIAHINKAISDGAKTWEDVLDAYNTGSFRVGEPPKDYIAKFWVNYDLVIKGEDENGRKEIN